MTKNKLINTTDTLLTIEPTKSVIGKIAIKM